MATWQRRARAVGYWFCTLVVVWEMTAGSLWDLLQIKFVRDVFDDLGYPHYLLLIIGVSKLPAALALMAPRFPRLKEWAYAGVFFNYTGAAASHLLVGEGPDKWMGPTVFAAMALVSWALRPPEKKLPSPSSSSAVQPLPWRARLIPLAIVVLLAVLALLTLPK